MSALAHLERAMPKLTDDLGHRGMVGIALGALGDHMADGDRDSWVVALRPAMREAFAGGLDDDELDHFTGASVDALAAILRGESDPASDDQHGAGQGGKL